MAPSYTHHPRNGDTYSAYNKPVAIIDWLAKNDVKEDYVLVIDADMVMRAPFTPEVGGASQQWLRDVGGWQFPVDVVDGVSLLWLGSWLQHWV